MWGRKHKSKPPLLDAEAAHREEPLTYSIPRRAVRESLRPGDYVKLLFAVDPPAGWVEVERMWVEVTASRTDGYSGRLANQPRYLSNLNPGDQVVFGPEHVAAREAGPDDPLYTDPNAFAVVSRRVWDDQEWPGRVERREIPDPQFSGWFVLTGDETDAYKADPSNFVPIAQGVLFDRFRVLDSGLEGPIGTTMVWDEEAVEYVAALR
jgi:hypothetical protein